MQKKEKIIEQFKIKSKPNYIIQKNENKLFEYAFKNKIPLILKGPTGCGKTRFIEYMAYKLKLPLVTVSCHEDLTASDLIGRYLFINDETIWEDGPLTLAVRYGGICYLDEIVEARKDTTVIIHSLTDDRRMLFIDKTQEVIKAHPDFLLVISYNPGYQNIMKELKESTKQRFASINFSYPEKEIEINIIQSESQIDRGNAEKLTLIGEKIRNLKGFGLNEGVSTRLLVYAARLMKTGLSPYDAISISIINTLTDDEELKKAIEEIILMFYEK